MVSLEFAYLKIEEITDIGREFNPFMIDIISMSEIGKIGEKNERNEKK